MKSFILFFLILGSFSVAQSRDMLGLITPKGGEIYLMSTENEIVWHSSTPGLPVDLEYFDANAQEWIIIASDLKSNEGRNSYSWDVPSDINLPLAMLRISTLEGKFSDNTILPVRFAPKPRLRESHHNTEVRTLDDDLVLFPNPTSSSINISSSVNYESVSVLDLSGQVLSQMPFSQELNLNFLSTGLYILRFQNGTSFKHKRIIINK